jgi:hypothetical protein
LQVLLAVIEDDIVSCFPNDPAGRDDDFSEDDATESLSYLD